MSILNYGELKTAVAGWLNRSDLTTIIPDFISLAEKEIARNLFAKTIRTDFTLVAGVDEAALPADCSVLRELRYHTASRRDNLTQVSVQALADYRSPASGQPNFYAVLSNVVLMDRAPDINYATKIVYYQAFTPLSTDPSTNEVLGTSPDIYLYGALIQATPYLEHDERIPLWQARFEKSIKDENILRERMELGAGPLVMRLPTVFG